MKENPRNKNTPLLPKTETGNAEKGHKQMHQTKSLRPYVAESLYRLI